jgi:membrane-associated phospholipid phosphatase
MSPLRRLLREAWLPLLALSLCPLVAQLAPGAPGVAMDHARVLRGLEQAIGIYPEPKLSAALAGEGWLAGPLAVVYLLAHVPVTGAVLGWVILSRPHAWPVVRTSFVLTQTVCAVVYVLWPCAPPTRLGVPDVTSQIWGQGTLDGARTMQSAYAAMPSGHVAFALVAGGALAWLAPRRWQRLAGAAWPALVIAITLATGNHFWLDAIAALLLVSVALGLALLPGSLGGVRLRPAFALARRR